MNIRVVLAIGLLLLLVGGLVGYFMYNKPHKDIVGAKADITITALELVAAFENDETVANAMYLNKVVAASGTLVDKTNNPDGTITYVLLDEFSGVSATLDADFQRNSRALISDISVGDELTVKGKCDGMIMLQGVILNKCSIEK